MEEIIQKIGFCHFCSGLANIGKISVQRAVSGQLRAAMQTGAANGVGMGQDVEDTMRKESKRKTKLMKY